MRLSPLHALIAASALVWSAPAFAQIDAATLAGDWSGALDVEGVQLRLVLHVKADNSATTATLDSLDQGAMAIPVSSIAREGDNMTFVIGSVGGRYAGTLSADGETATGTWTQGLNTFPLELKRP